MVKNDFIDAIEARERGYAAYLLSSKVDSICYIEVEGSTVKLVLSDANSITINVSMQKVEEFLPRTQFVKCSSRYVINTSYIIEMWASSQPLLVMSCGAVLPLSSAEMFKLKSFLKKKRIFQEVDQQK
jgi:DNA-binding LytR/AlgR family response regulator